MQGVLEVNLTAVELLLESIKPWSNLLEEHHQHHSSIWLMSIMLLPVIGRAGAFWSKGSGPEIRPGANVASGSR